MPASNPRRSLLLLNLAVVVERQTGRDPEALELWERFRREAAAVAAPELLVRADERIRVLRTRIERRAQGATFPSTATRGSEDTSEGSVSPIGPVLLGAGAAALLAGGILGGLVLGNDATLVAMCPGGRCHDATALSLAREVEQMAIATDVLFVAGGVIAAVGVLLTLILRDEPVRASADCGPNECGLVLTGAL